MSTNNLPRDPKEVVASLSSSPFFAFFTFFLGFTGYITKITDKKECIAQKNCNCTKIKSTSNQGTSSSESDSGTGTDVFDKTLLQSCQNMATLLADVLMSSALHHGVSALHHGVETSHHNVQVPDMNEIIFETSEDEKEIHIADEVLPYVSYVSDGDCPKEPVCWKPSSATPYVKPRTQIEISEELPVFHYISSGDDTLGEKEGYNLY